MRERVKILFVCSQNRIRSLTAEKLFEGHAVYDVRSAGTEQDARIKVTAGHIGWADKIFVMEMRHRDRMRKKFREELTGKEVICLFIPDEYDPLSDDLLEMLRARLTPHLDLSECRKV
jgi:predicted protein tyrosine phosphatase